MRQAIVGGAIGSALVLLLVFAAGFSPRSDHDDDGVTQNPISTPSFNPAVVNQPEFSVNPTVDISHKPFIVHCWDPVKQEFEDREDYC